jgi:3-oxoacyl-[acyl-carrier protein] reductase
MSEQLPHVPPSSVVLVSGGSRGLGLAMVSDLLEHGVKVASFSRSSTPEVEALADKHGDAFLFRALDGNDTAAVTSFLKEAGRTLGPVDGLVNNAAIGQDSLHVHTSPERIEQIIRTNLVAPLLLTRAFTRAVMARGGRGRVVMVTSICGQRGYSGLVAYSATKAGLDGAMRALAREMHGRLLVNSLAPGFFASEMSSVLGDTQLETIARRTPSGRLVEAEDMLPVLRMLLLEQTNTNGQTIVVDGGGSI